MCTACVQELTDMRRGAECPQNWSAPKTPIMWVLGTKPWSSAKTVTAFKGLLSPTPPGPELLFHSQRLRYVNRLIYLVCFTAQLRPTTPTLAGDSSSVTSCRMLNHAGSSGLPYSKFANSTHKDSPHSK